MTNTSNETNAHRSNSAAQYPTIKDALMAMSRADAQKHFASQKAAVAVMVAMRVGGAMYDAASTVKLDAVLRDGGGDMARKLKAAARAMAEESFKDDGNYVATHKGEASARMANAIKTLKDARNNIALATNTAVALLYAGVSPEDYKRENDKKSGTHMFHLDRKALELLRPTDDKGSPLAGTFMGDPDKAVPLASDGGIYFLTADGTKSIRVPINLKDLVAASERAAGKAAKKKPGAATADTVATLSETATGVDAMLSATAAKLVETNASGEYVPTRMLRDHTKTNADAVGLFMHLGAALGAFKFNDIGLMTIDKGRLHELAAASLDGNPVDLTSH